MCLGVPGQVVEVDSENEIATVDFWGVKKQVRLEICDAPVQPGDYILNHVGFAIRRIPPWRSFPPSIIRTGSGGS